MSPSYSAKIALKKDLKKRRRRVSTTAAVSWREWEEVAVVWRENCHQTTDIKSDGGYRLINTVRSVSRDQFYPMRARRNYSVGYKIKISGKSKRLFS